MRKRDSGKIASSNRGSVLIFTTIILIPIIFFLCTLTLDLTLYFKRQQDIQDLIDAAVYHAYRYLPSRIDTELAARSYLEKHLSPYDGNIENSTIKSSYDDITVSYREHIDFNFASYFGISSKAEITAQSQIRIAPLDCYLAIDTSSYMAPSLPDQRPWGDPLSWPEADFFRYDKKIPLLRSSSYTSIYDEIDPRLLTQQCFNPIYSEHKLAAIGIYDYFAGFDMNSIGFGFFPGNYSVLDTARDVLKPGLRRLQSGESDFDAEYGSLYFSNSYCLAAADREQASAAYQFPEYSHRLKALQECNEKVDPLTFQPLPSVYTCMRSRDVIWSRAISSQNIQAFDQVVKHAFAKAATAPYRPERGSLSNTQKVAIVLMGNLPRIGNQFFPALSVMESLRQELNDITEQVEAFNLNFTLYILIHPPSTADQLDWNSKINSLTELLSDFNSRKLIKGKIDIKVFSSANAQKLKSDVIANLLLSKKLAVIAK